MMKKTIFWVIILTVISLFAISCSALDAFLSAPPEAYLNEPFSVGVEAGDSITYDVKIYAQTKNGSIVSEIDNFGWKNPRYYIKGAYPEQKNYSIRITKPGEGINICLKLRPSGKTKSLSEICSPVRLSDSLKASEADMEQVKIHLISNINSENKKVVTNLERERIIIFLSFAIFVLLILTFLTWNKL